MRFAVSCYSGPAPVYQPFLPTQPSLSHVHLQLHKPQAFLCPHPAPTFSYCSLLKAQVSSPCLKPCRLFYHLRVWAIPTGFSLEVICLSRERKGRSIWKQGANQPVSIWCLQMDQQISRWENKASRVRPLGSNTS